MLNDLILVGRLTKEIEIRSTDSGKKVGTLFLAVPRSFKNMEGVYETDFIPCTIWEEKAKTSACTFGSNLLYYYGILDLCALKENSFGKTDLYSQRRSRPGAGGLLRNTAAGLCAQLWLPAECQRR